MFLPIINNDFFSKTTLQRHKGYSYHSVHVPLHFGLTQQWAVLK